MSPVRAAKGRSAAAAAVTLLVVLVAGCTNGTDSQSEVERAQAQVTAKEKALADAKDASTKATAAFCSAGTDYISALDRYGDVLTQTAPTVGDVVTAGSDLRDPKQAAMTAGQDAQAASQAVADAENALAQAQIDLAAAQAAAATTGAPVAPGTPATFATATPVAPADAINRVKQADTEFTDAQKGISDSTPLKEAGQAFNAAAVALEMSWLRLVSQAGCLTQEQAVTAQQTVAHYTTTLQQALTDAGYYTAPVDGIYGPATVAAVEALQKAHGLPVTGTVDKATSAALQADVAAKGGAAAQAETASTAALQQTLHILGYWDGPIDGVPSDELTNAIIKLQKDLGVEQTGVVDATTIAALEKALKDATTPTPSPTPSATTPEPTATS